MADPLAHNLPLLRRLERAEDAAYAREAAAEQRLPMRGGGWEYLSNPVWGLFCLRTWLNPWTPPWERSRWLADAVRWLR